MIWGSLDHAPYHPEFHTFLSSCPPPEYFFSNYKDWTTSDGELSLGAFIFLLKYTSKMLSNLVNFSLQEYLKYVIQFCVSDFSLFTIVAFFTEDCPRCFYRAFHCGLFILSTFSAFLFLVVVLISTSKTSGVSCTCIVGSADQNIIAWTYYSHTQNCFALLPSLYPWLRPVYCTNVCSTMFKEEGKWLKLHFNIPETKEMLKGC